MESDEPSLVPQWLKGGGSASSTFNSSHANNSNGSSNGPTALRDLSISTKRHIPDWEDRHFSDRNFRPQNFRHLDTAKGAADDKHWKAHSEPFVGRPARHSRSNSFSDDRHNNAAGSDPRRGRGFGGIRGRDDLNGGHDAGDVARDNGHRSGSHDDANLGYGARNAFDRNFPSLGEQRPPAGATPPSFRHSTTGFLAAKASGNWTSKLADSPSPQTPANPLPILAPAASAPEPTPTPAAAPAAVPAPAPKMSEALQQTLTSRATSADRQRLDQLAAKQSRTLIPVLAASSKSRTSSSAPSNKFLAPLRPDGSKPVNGRAPAPSPFAVPKPAPAAALQRAHSANAAAASAAGAPAAAAAAAVPNGMVALKPAGSGKVLERTSFFDSLRRKPSAEPSAAKALAAAAAAAAPAAAGSNGNASPAAAAVGSTGGAAAAAVAQQQAQGEGGLAAAGAAPNSAGAGELKGLAKLRSLAEAEEEAFLRSLGWEEPQEGEDEGLTEEEIAAFLAASEQRQKAASTQGPPAVGSTPRLVVGGRGAGLRRGAGQAAFAPGSFDSQTFDSDSDSDC